MKYTQMLDYIKDVLKNIPPDWLNLTTHRLDVYEEALAKTQFLEQFEKLYEANNSDLVALGQLPTAFDYIRLGHPLSCLLEWVIARQNDCDPEHVISFSSATIPILAILRKNSLEDRPTQVFYTGELPEFFEAEILKSVYDYQFTLKKVEKSGDVSRTEGSTIFISGQNDIGSFDLHSGIDFFVSVHSPLGSILLINGKQNADYIAAVQHVRRRETIAMTPADAYTALSGLTGKGFLDGQPKTTAKDKASVLGLLSEITGADTKALLGSSGLSVQYAIMMGLIHNASEKHSGKAIKIVVPPNCYGGTNDQARRVAACLDNVEVVDLPVDGGNDMVRSIDVVLDEIASQDAVPYIIAEIPTNPRVEVPDLVRLRAVLSAPRKTPAGDRAIDPVFILDQTFCPNVHFLGEGEILSTVRTISYASGSKFPSGGLCTAGYCVANEKAAGLIDKIELHLRLCDNEATSQQIEILAKQLPSMNQRIERAYKNTREFVDFISLSLPAAKINFVSEELAQQGFTPSVFSLDLPAKGSTAEEKERYKRELNLKLINLMITEIPLESKFCVSYGQLKGCYWTVPATSTQGTTKEGDKDYIVRASLSPDMDLERHKKVFLEFVKNL